MDSARHRAPRTHNHCATSQVTVAPLRDNELMAVGLLNVIGAVLAALLGAAAAWWFGRRSSTGAESELLIRNYLVQLQDAIESLGHRINNLQEHGGTSSMTSPQYFIESSRYVIATVLAQHRRLTINGVFGHLEQRQPGSGVALQARLEFIERELGRSVGHSFPRYLRRELADLALDWRADLLRPVSYSDFQRRIADDQHHTCAQAVDLVSNELLGAHAVLLALDLAAQTVAEHTGIDRTFSIDGADGDINLTTPAVP